MIPTLLLTLAIALQASPADRLAGTWNANLEKSQRDANHQFTELTMRFDVSPDAVTLTYSGINRAGHRESATVVFHPDGKEYPTPQAPGVVTTTAWKGRVLESVGKKDGVVIGHSAYEVSADGSTLTASVNGIHASGRSFEQVIVFDRDKTVPQH